MPLSDLEQAFEESLNAAAEIKGQREKIIFRSVELDALINTDITDLVMVGGGEANASVIKVSLRTSDVNLPINELEPLVIRGEMLAVFNYAALEGRIDIVVGDPGIDDTE